jgi:hypothetical protein
LHGELAPTLQILVQELLVVSKVGDGPEWVFTVPDLVWEEMRARWPDDCRPAKK